MGNIKSKKKRAKRLFASEFIVEDKSKNDDIIENEKEKDKIIIEDISKELKIHPKKINNINKKTFELLNPFFEEYKCSKCLKKIIINIERNKENNISYITSKCRNNHIEKKPISEFLEENKFTIDENFIFYDYIPSKIRKEEKPTRIGRFERWNGNFSYHDDYPYREDEIYLICFKCKKIFDVKKSQLDKINHEHFLFEYYNTTK